ncbi:MAG TPA: lipoate--protein ligase [Flavobacteriales bacterium]|nr:lipoate--protein ligase [Flavobacteriales bacterium]HRP80927.1 lipoate--protein ligase [Flavobacteriales bacterium]
MLLIDNGNSTDPAFNLALEEHCLLNLPMEPGYLLLYVNDPCIVVGKHQNAWEEINTDLVDERGIPVLRRISGGGTVYHDHGNLNFSFLRPHNSRYFNNYTHFTGAVAEALQGMGVPAVLNHRGDILMGDRKISGSAQAMRKGRLGSHGTLLFRSDLQLISPVLRPKPGRFSSHSRQSVRSRVGNAGDHLLASFSMEDLRHALAEALLPHPVRHYLPTPDELAQVRQLADTKYRTWEWNYAESPPFAMERTGTINGKEVQLRVCVEKGRIKEVLFHCTAETTVDLGGLSGMLVNCRYQRHSIHEVLATWGVNHSGQAVEPMLSLLY